VPLTPTAFYADHLAQLHRLLLEHRIAKAHLSGTGIRLDGNDLGLDDRFDLPFGELSTLEFAHLFCVFDGSRVHQQAEKFPSRDDAPPGLYFTVINSKIIRNQHKNRAGLISEAVGETDLFIEALHVDHFFLNEQNTPRSLGTLAFTLCSITAHLASLAHISLVAAGGVGFNPRHVGYKVWPRLGFDAALLPGETHGVLHLEACQTVQDVIAIDGAWWDAHGSQRLMAFDLAVASRSWQKLIPYVREKVLAESTL
jgi:hypothetical protein